MAYAPPVGTADLALSPGYYQPSTYTPPVGTADLLIGYSASAARFLTVQGETLAPTGAVVVLKVPEAVVDGETLAPTGLIVATRHPLVAIAGETLAPTGAIRILPVVVGVVAGETLAPTGRLTAVYDPNLLSAVHALTATAWQEGDVATHGLREALQDAQPARTGSRSPWNAAPPLSGLTGAPWQDAAPLTGVALAAWQPATGLLDGRLTPWREAPRLDRSAISPWTDSARLERGLVSDYQPNPPRLDGVGIPRWQDGQRLEARIVSRANDGPRVTVIQLARWNPGGYPGNAPNPGPAIPPIIPWPWGTTLHIHCPLPGTTLRIGRSPCVLIAEYEIPYRRSYMTTNTASLVRWPDLTPLPVTGMTIETDFDSWCWGLTATLAGPDAWPFVQPNPLACEVLATINGQVWRFLLDVPSRNRGFNSDRVTLKGRSRSAWLHDPYTRSQNFSESQAREMQQLGEAALATSGFTLDWQGENWLVPAGRYTSWNTPIGVLIRLANTTDDGLYSHPSDAIITLQKRWPVASWLVDGATADLAIPESAILSLTQNPVYTQPLNGVYVSGTSHGALALVKIAGTDGALQPAEPIVNELLCDEAGVAARQRGLNALSDSGAGWEMDAETLFNPLANPAFPLVPPGRIVSIAGLKGVSRSCRISAQWAGGALSVRQSVGLERREVEA